MKWTRPSVAVVVAGLLLGLPAMVAAQRPTEGVGGGGGGGAASSRGGESGGGPASGGSTSAGASGPIAGPGGYSTATGSAASGGGSWGGSSNPASSGWGGSNAIRPRDEVFQRPGFADVYNNRGITRNSSAPATGTETPWYSRPRGDAPASGTAMLRTDYIASRPPGGGGGGNPGWEGGYPGYGYPYYPGYGPGWGYYYNGWYMYPYTWGSYGYGYPDCGYGGYGMGYFYYNPFNWNYYGGCGYYGSGMYGADYGGYGPSYGGGSVGYGQYQSRGGLRLKVKPTNARVYVDGYFAGKVDQFDSSFQKLEIERGKHKIEISALGYAPVVFEVEIRANETITWEGNLEKIVEKIK